MPDADGFSAYVVAMTALHPGFPGLFQAPAPAGAIAEVAATLGRRVPDALFRLLARHDGSGCHMVVPDFMLLSARQIADEWRLWEELRISVFDPDGTACTPVGPVRGDRWWQPGWVPFAADGAGNFLCLDTEPAPGGTNGQVITLWHDDDCRTVLAPGLDPWFQDMAAAVRDGGILWDADAEMAVRRESSAP